MQLVIIFYMLKKLLLLPPKHRSFLELRPSSLNVQIPGSIAATRPVFLNLHNAVPF